MSLTRMVWILGLMLVFRCCLATPVYQFANARQEAQFQHLLKSLRCVVCQNQDLADSNARLAVELRSMVHDMVLNGKSDQDIMQFLTMRYGDFILFNPPVRWVTSLLWFGPGLFLLLGILVYGRYFLRRSRHV